MKKLALCGALLLLAVGCQKKSGNFWEDNQTGAGYSRENAASLWGNSSQESQTAFSASNEEFLPLNDEDLKAQFSDGAIPQPASGLGEGGLPGIDEFGNPTGEMASVFRPVFFNTDDHILRNKDYLDTIKKIGSYLKSHPNTYVVVEGHADERGPEAYNLALGSRRANYVRSLLVKEGVDLNQIHTISYGKEKPFATGHGPDVWSQNRRAHFRVNQK